MFSHVLYFYFWCVMLRSADAFFQQKEGSGLILGKEKPA